MRVHNYDAHLAWSGSTRSYDAYDRTHQVRVANTQFPMTADRAFLGDPSLLNPEQLLVVAASSCQLLSFLAVAARSRVEVLAYTDHAHGEMPEDVQPVRLTRITLRPRVRVRGGDIARIDRLMHKAHQQCYIANSLRTEILLQPEIEIE